MEVNSSTVLDLFGSNPFVLCPQAMSLLSIICHNVNNMSLLKIVPYSLASCFRNTFGKQCEISN